MRANIPLLPLTVELRWRPLHLQRFSLEALILTVAVSAILLALVAEARRVNQAMSYHVTRAVEVTRDRPPSYDPMPMSRWHSTMALNYRAAAEQLDLLLFVFIVVIGTVIAVAVTGSFIAWIRPIE
jgi:hypothetical protein